MDLKIEGGKIISVNEIKVDRINGRLRHLASRIEAINDTLRSLAEEKTKLEELKSELEKISADAKAAGIK